MKKKHVTRLRDDMPKDARTRAWTLIVYPDSAPEDWRYTVASLGWPYYISPLHDKDFRADGTVKKPHWHLVLYADNKKSISQIQEISDKLSGVKVDWEHCAVGDMRKMVRYLVHFDDADKHQYDVKDIEQGCGADWLQYFEQSSDIDTAVGEMMEWIDQDERASLAALSRYARDNRRDWFRALTAKRTVFMRAYCQSVKWERSQGIGAEKVQIPEQLKDMAPDAAKIAIAPIIARDACGERILVCDECGRVGTEHDFTEFGEAEFPNMGRCRDCSGA